MKIIHVVGARPNLMKVSPVMSALASRDGISQQLVHTGQHYDANMSDVFFAQLGLPSPDLNLEVGSGSHAVQTAQVMLRFEQAVQAVDPDLVLVYGDVNSTLAAALVCSKLGIPLAHVEAGLRSFDRTMPEEVNRVLTDHVAELLFTPSIDANENLAREGIVGEGVKFVGNVMIDTLTRLLPRAESLWSEKSRSLGVNDGSFGLVTLHRASNVDDTASLIPIIRALQEISGRIPLIFPVHPRTRQHLGDLTLGMQNIRLLEPLGYLQFLCLQRHACFVLTDSGGIQEETTYMGIPCLTVRRNTERPITITMGTNYLVGDDLPLLHSTIDVILSGGAKPGVIPPLWDGRASDRIADCIQGRFCS